VVKKDLRDGERIRISSGCLVAFTKNVQFEVQTMTGFKNVLFGGEGLFVTTLTGPGTIWLQGMPPNRMISEIARRIPSGSVGLCIPVGLGGGSGDSDADVGSDVDESMPQEDESVENLKATTEDSINDDRNATVASSGAFSNELDPLDSESSSALFGDATASEDKSSIVSSSTDAFSNEISTEKNSTASFSSEDTTFGEDLTNNQHFDDFDQDETSFSSDDFTSNNGEGSDEGGSSNILEQLWDFFTDNDN